MLASIQAGASDPPARKLEASDKGARGDFMRGLPNMQVIRYHQYMPLVFLGGAVGAVASLFFGFAPLQLFLGTGLGLLAGVVLAISILGCSTS